jgi:Recombination directionality factor-like
MPIYGLTHKNDGTAILRRSVTTKIAIGLPPKDKNDHPTRLDHFIFQKKGQRGSGMSAEVVWDIDEEKTAHYGKNCREAEIILLDNNPEAVFRTEYAWWTATQKRCWGDGEQAMRRTAQSPRGEEWGPCANEGCSDVEEGRCHPSGDLYFLLADYPTLGTICKLHTSSYQSIRELHAALEDIRNVTGGRLMGLKLKLFVRPEKNAYLDREGNRKSGTKHVLGLELAIDNVRQLPAAAVEASDAFEGVRQQLEGRVIEVEDPEEERAPAVHAEFYPASHIKPASATANGRPAEKDEAKLGDKEKELRDRIEEAFADLRLTTAQRQGLLDQHRDDPQALLDRLTRAIEKRKAEQAQNGTGTDQQVASKNGSARSRVNGHPNRTQSTTR